MRALKRISLSALCAALIGQAGAAIAADRYLIIGGGPTPDASQVSIESNVLWVQQVLAGRGFSAGQTWFASGRPDWPDVRLLEPDNAEAQAGQALARVYGQQAVNFTRFRPNTVPDNRGATSLENIRTLLQQTLPQLGSGDNLLLVYSGHGSYESDTSANALRLWGETRLPVTEFTELLHRTPAQATVRFVLPQCFSGAFARSIFANPAQMSGPVATNRCGFLSVPENQIAEGCTAGIDVGDYRDYTTYFFAALSGSTRTGQPLDAAPDLNGDGAVSLHEAHFYAIAHGFSTDIPRSTSEFYLETWQPWYVRWQSAGPFAADNEYAALAQRLARRLGVAEQPGSAAFAARVLALRRDYSGRLERGTADLETLHQQEKTVRKALQHALELRWPNAANAHTASYTRFLNAELAAATAWIEQQSSYPQLVDLQNRIAALELTNLELERQQAQYARLQRALTLARIRDSFERHADADAKARYQALASCEAWIMPAAPQTNATTPK